MATEKTWTLYIDESGRFDAEERVALVVGGVLCPGRRPDLDGRRRFRNACDALRIAYPPHATNLTGDTHETLFSAATECVRAADGIWIFVVSGPASNAANAVSAYVQMLGILVDLTARRLAHEGSQELVVVPAQRTVAMSHEEVRRAGRLGLGREEGTLPSGDGVMFRAWVEGEVRQAIDALAREDAGSLAAFPELAEIDVVRASGVALEPGIAFADFGCNYVYRRVKAGGVDLGPLEREDVIVIDRNAAAALRRIDRRLRETPADVHGAARAAAVVRARVEAGGGSTFAFAQRGSAAAADVLFSRGCEALEKKLPERRCEAVAHALAGAAYAALAGKTGDYEGTWSALSVAWAGDGALAQKLRRAVQDRELGARLWRCTFECANHRGDVEAARTAGDCFDEVLQGGASLVLVAEDLAMRNFAAVAAQNRLPADEETVGAIREELRAGADELRQRCDDAGDVVEIAITRRGDSPAPRVPDDASEVALWRCFGREPRWRFPDRERGRLIGTAARSLAFAGELDRALEWGLDARSFFAEGFDLRFNAAVLGRILLEKARVSGAPDLDRIQPVLDSAGVGGLDARSVKKRVEENAAARFELDLVLRAILWAPGAVRQVSRWRDVLEDDGSSSVFATLAALRSHPTELIGRHAGEFLRAAGGHDAARRWFDLSLALSAEAEKDSAVARFAPFTRWLAQGGTGEPSGREGSVTNPTFEYR